VTYNKRMHLPVTPLAAASVAPAGDAQRYTDRRFRERMKLLLISLLSLLATSAVVGDTATLCTLDAPWDLTREILAENIQDPEFVPVASVDEGKLLAAVAEWLKARLERDAGTLQRLTVPLPDQYQQVNRDWIEPDLAKLDIYEARAAVAHVDPTNSKHVTVLSEVAVRLRGVCTVSTIGTSWVKLNGQWKSFPGGATTH